mmetsp:Transcript_100983/g.324226  ORF Transcript_100983/g.324226 Transcript_100983/m.324226 type:complete len:247 (+) Transcript_100983:612-1352(+)
MQGLPRKRHPSGGSGAADPALRGRSRRTGRRWQAPRAPRRPYIWPQGARRRQAAAGAAIGEATKAVPQKLTMILMTVGASGVRRAPTTSTTKEAKEWAGTASGAKQGSAGAMSKASRHSIRKARSRARPTTSNDTNLYCCKLRRSSGMGLFVSEGRRCRSNSMDPALARSKIFPHTWSSVSGDQQGVIQGGNIQYPPLRGQEARAVHLWAGPLYPRDWQAQYGHCLLVAVGPWQQMAVIGCRVESP